MQQDDNTNLPPIYSQQSVPGQQASVDDNVDMAVPPAISQMINELPQEANDIDLIEKEWIVKAKQIVAHTSNDPYHQQAAISQMKAEYMRKRYNKEVKGA